MAYGNLDFYEAPDYASELEKQYQKINQGFENREEAERRNDATRIQQAGMPVKMIVAAANFSKTAAQVHQQIKVDSQKKQTLFADDSGYSPEEVALANKLYKKGNELLLKDYKEKLEQAKEAEADGELLEATRLMTRSEYRKGRFGFLKQGIQYNDIANFDKDFQEANPNWESMSRQEMFDATTAFRAGKVEAYKKDGVPQALIDSYSNALTQFREGKINESIQADFTRAKTNLEKENYLRVVGVFRATDGETLKSDVLQLVDEFKVDEKFSGGLKRLIAYVAQAVSSGELSPAQAQKLPSILLEHFGKQGKTEELKKIHSKIFDDASWDDVIHEAQKKNLRQEEEKIAFKSIEKDIEYKNFEADIIKETGTFPTRAQKQKKIEELGLDGTNLSQTILGAITQEDKEQTQVVERLTEKYVNSESIQLSDLNGIVDANVFATWKSRVDTSNEWSLSSTDSSKIKTEFFKTRLESHPELATYTNNDQAEILNLAEGDLRIIFAEEYGNEPNRAVALEKAKARVYTKIDNGHYKKLLDQGISYDNTYSKQLQVAKEYVGLFPNSVLTQVIPGSEDALKAAMENPNEVQHFYKQIMRNQKKVNGKYVTARDLQNAQVAISKGGEVPMSEFDKQIYELDNGKTLRLLKFHPDRGRVIRAKIEAFKDDKIIAYDEIEHLLPETTDIPLLKTTQQAQEEGIASGDIHTLGAFEPRVGDWKELPGAFRIGYAVYDGENWIYSTTRNTEGQKYSGPVNDFMDQDGYYKPFDGTSADLRTTFFGGDEPINKEDAPRPGEWYKTTAKGTETPYVIWNGRDWVPSPVKGKFRKEYDGNREFDLRPQENILSRK
tara:strand:+ start:771 stop:3293 length:2523 start_codon:yes stop_codon:yes gene_type:complete